MLTVPLRHLNSVENTSKTIATLAKQWRNWAVTGWRENLKKRARCAQCHSQIHGNKQIKLCLYLHRTDSEPSTHFRPLPGAESRTLLARETDRAKSHPKAYMLWWRLCMLSWGCQWEQEEEVVFFYWTGKSIRLRHQLPEDWWHTATKFGGINTVDQGFPWVFVSHIEKRPRASVSILPYALQAKSLRDTASFQRFKQPL